MERIGVVGIDLRRLAGEFGSDALRLSGNNFGNMLFTNAIYKQLTNCMHIGFKLDVQKVKSECTRIVIPASNWINGKEDWGFLADTLEAIDLPICLVGLGSQLQSDKDIDIVSDGTKRFLRVVSERTKAIGVRGYFTQQVLANLGFDNTVALGCPSIFSNFEIPSLRDFVQHESLRIGVGPTRYHLPKGGELSDNDKQRSLYQFALDYASSIYYQSESFEIGLLNREDVLSQADDALAYYDKTDWSLFEDKIMRKGKYHKDLDQWIADVRKDDIYIGTRIHGAVAAILAGTPAILLTHDNRTKELAEIMSIPSFSLSTTRLTDMNDVKSLILNADFNSISKTCTSNIEKFKKFYSLNGFV